MAKRIKSVDVAIVASLILLAFALFLPRLMPSIGTKGRIADENGDGRVTLEDYHGKRIGTITGVTYDQMVEKFIHEGEVKYYSNYPDLIVALQAKQIDAFLIDEPSMDVMIRENPFLGKLDQELDDWKMCYAISDNNKFPNLQTELNTYIKAAKENGELEEIKKIWFEFDESKQVIPPLENLSAQKGTLRVAMDATYPPIVYVRDNQLVGYEIDLLYRFAKAYNYGLQFMDMTFDAILPAVSLGRCEIGGSGLEYTPEHADSILLSEPTLDSNVSLAVPATDLPGGGKSMTSSLSLWDDVKSSLNKNFLAESRWLLLVKGIGITCLITMLSALFGSLIGFGICLLRRADSHMANPVSDVYIHLMRGIPKVVLLMILFYVIFNGVQIESLWVAVIGFSLTFGACAAEVMQSGLDSVDQGQEEAALSLGYSRNQAFFRFLFPQAEVHFLPVYRGELVSLLNDTSIVGYIAVQDLTKMSDIIRSRSYEAFVPLLTSTLVYFLLARIIRKIIERILKRVDWKHAKRTPGGEIL